MRPLLHPLALAVSTASLAALSSGLTFADEDLSTVLVTAQRSDAADVVTADDIEKRQASDLEDLFRDTPSVDVGGGVGIGQKLYLRGIEDTNLNVTVDGARQGGYLFHHTGRLTIDPALIKVAEVDSGPATADDGPGALGGSVRFETKDAQDLLRPDQRIGARISAGSESAADATRGTTAVYGRLGEDLGLMAYVSGRNSDDYKTGDGDTQPETGGQQRAYLVKMSLLDHGDQSLSLSAERRTDHGSYAMRPHMPAIPGREPTYQEMERETFTLNHRWQPDSPWLDVSTTLYRSTTELDSVDMGSTSEAENTGGDVHNRMRFATAAVDHELTSGVDYYQEDTSHTVDDGDAGPNGDDSAENLGLYLQDRMRWGDWGLSMGARLDDYSTDYGQADTVEGDEISPNATLTWEAVDGLTLHAGYGEAIRGAKTREVLMNGSEVKIADGLKPEQSRQREIGAEWSGNDALLNGDHLTLALTGFDTDIENYQAYQNGRHGPGPSLLYNEDGTVESRGYEASVAWQLDGYSTRLAYSSVDMEDQNGDPLGDGLGLGASRGDTWTWTHEYRVDEQMSLGYTLHAQERLTDVPDGSAEKAGYVTHDLRARWTPAAYPGMALTLAVNNVFDKAYSDQTSFSTALGTMQEPGRDVRLSASYRF